MPNSEAFVQSDIGLVHYNELIRKGKFPKEVYFFVTPGGFPAAIEADDDNVKGSIIPVFDDEQKLEAFTHHPPWDALRTTENSLGALVVTVLEEALVILNPSPSDLQDYDEFFFILNNKQT